VLQAHGLPAHDTRASHGLAAGDRTHRTTGALLTAHSHGLRRLPAAKEVHLHLREKAHRVLRERITERHMIGTLADQLAHELPKIDHSIASRRGW
jgi:hypothetical protein